VVNYWKVVFATMVIFGTGVVTGGLLVQHAIPLRPKTGARTAVTPRPPPVPTPGTLKLELLRRMQKELGLTAEQNDRIDRILSQSQERTRKLMEPLKPQLAEELKRAREQFREALTVEQRARFDEYVRQQQQQQHQREQHQREQREPHRPVPAREQPTPEVPQGTS